MGIYDQAPQLYAQGLNQGLQNQFQLATQAQPVTQFLAGLRQAQALRMQQEQIDRQNAIQEESARHNRDTEDISQQNIDRYYADQNRKETQSLNVDALKYAKQMAESGTGSDNPQIRNFNDMLAAKGIKIKVPEVQPLKIIGGTNDTLAPGEEAAPAATFSGLIGKDAGLTPGLPAQNPFSSATVSGPDTIMPGEPGQTIWNSKQGQAQAKDLVVQDLKNKKQIADQKYEESKIAVQQGNQKSLDAFRQAGIERGKIRSELDRALNEAKVAHYDTQDTELTNKGERADKLLPSQIQKNEAYAGAEDRKFMALGNGQSYLTPKEQDQLAVIARDFPEQLAAAKAKLRGLGKVVP